ncbi:MAG: hypothetical protein K2X42_01045, partial [Burkholderiaceae bacterium]|nr:hypothetical protein [Burkholderiaceae bacterium]
MPQALSTLGAVADPDAQADGLMQAVPAPDQHGQRFKNTRLLKMTQLRSQPWHLPHHPAQYPLPATLMNQRANAEYEQGNSGLNVESFVGKFYSLYYI